VLIATSVSVFRRRSRIVRAGAVVLTVVVLALVGYRAGVAVEEHNETARTTPLFDPPVWAGQNPIPPCAGGFYARHASTIVLTMSAHCYEPGVTVRDDQGRELGVLGPRAQLADCPAGRFCSPSDMLTLELAPESIPWGHLNMVDLGAGGYRTFAPGTRPLACGDIAVGARIEIDGREHYRVGRVVAQERYEFASDTIFPCLFIGDSLVTTGNSGGVVLVAGEPGGIVAREIGGQVGFTPLAEGLDNLGLTICTAPDCDLSPDGAVQP
jgi:hypothetical protein